MSTDQLKQLLGELADEVRPVSLHQQAATQSRRTRLRRAMAAGVGAVVALSLGTAGAVGLADIRNDAGVTERPADASGINELDGIFYGIDPNSTNWLLSLTEGRVMRHFLDDVSDTRNLRVSPDGRWVAYLTESAADVPGHVVIGDVTTGETVAVYDAGPAYLCSAPAWSPDGSRLYFDTGNQQYGYISMDDIVSHPQVSNVAVRGCNLQVVNDSNGGYLLYSTVYEDDTVEIIGTNPDGGEWYVLNGDAIPERQRTSIALVAASPDGTLLCVQNNPDDDELYIDTTCNTIVDTETGADITLGAEIFEYGSWHGTPATFVGSNRLLISVPDMDVFQLYEYNGLERTGRSGEYIGRVGLLDKCQPSGAAFPELLRYVPDDSG